ncbi:TspO/MBR family protein [Sphingomonas sp. S1-29]|uniref:TspO/MBR family protein n=1 Tax=Sphingomonas sp. S1-29 TaxID=2991074 RepID=UPI003A0FD334
MGHRHRDRRSATGPSPSPSLSSPRAQRWYDRLRKPGFTPPAPVFALTWPTIQAAQAYSGYSLLRAPPSPERTTALVFWGANQIGVAGWSEGFFRLRAPGWAALGSAALGGSAVGHVGAARQVAIRAAVAGLPLAAWVGLATLLAEEVWRRNDTPAA